MPSSSDRSHGPCRRPKCLFSHMEKITAPAHECQPPVQAPLWETLFYEPSPTPAPPPWGRVAVDLTCASGYSSPVPARTAAPSAAGSCWSTGRGLWRWWPSGWSPAPARTRWNSGWRKYCALPAMGNKEINKKAKAPLMRRSGQLGYNRVLRPRNHLGGPSIVTSAQWTHHIFSQVEKELDANIQNVLMTCAIRYI